MDFKTKNSELLPSGEIEILSSSQSEPLIDTDSEKLSSSYTSEYEPPSSQFSKSSCSSEDSQVTQKKQ